VVPHADRARFEELADDFLTDYRVNDKRSLERAEGSAEHLKSYFAEWKAINITTPAVRAYIAKRQEAKAGNGTVNRELAALKRMVALALQAEELLRRPYIPKLDEDNVADRLLWRSRISGPLRSPAGPSEARHPLRPHLRLADQERASRPDVGRPRHR
jgi:hypothetical protein